jgi:hypothetical protein
MVGMDDFREQRFRRTTMRFRTRMIATTAAVALLAPPFLFAAEDATSSSAKATAVDSAVTPDAVGIRRSACYAGGGPVRGSRALFRPRTYRSYPRAELFLGYSYLHGMPCQPTLSPGNRMVFG